MTTTTFYSNTTTAVSSFFAFEDLEFSQAFHRTPSDQPKSSQPRPGSQCQPGPATQSEPEPEPRFEPKRARGSVRFAAADDFRLASCTEGLGFESSNMMVSDSCCDCDCCSSDRMINEDYCNNGSSVNRDLRGDRREKRSPLPEKKDFPPPLSSLSKMNGRRNFMLKSVRNNGRLEIVRVLINRPEILCASRQNGRLRLQLVRDFIDDESECEYEEEETGEERENEEEERDNEEERETTAALAVAVAEEEERERKIPAVRRCFQREVLFVWGQERHRCVTTM